MFFFCLCLNSCLEKNENQTKPQFAFIRTDYFTNDNRYVLVSDLKTVNYLFEHSNSLSAKSNDLIKPFIGAISVVFAYKDQYNSVVNMNNHGLGLIIKDDGKYIICTSNGKYVDDKFATEIIEMFLKGKQEKY